jgi:hypothetical protein
MNNTNTHTGLTVTATELAQLRHALQELRIKRDYAGTGVLEHLGGAAGEAAFESLCLKVAEPQIRYFD